MGAYILKRVVGAIGVLLGASVLVFTLIHLAPGDPVSIMYGPLSTGGAYQEMVSEEALHRIREELGLNKTIVTQYSDWIGRVIRLDLGFSFRTRQPVTTELLRRWPATVILALFAFGIEVVLAVIFGILTAMKAGKPIDHLARLGAALFRAVPNYWLGLLLLYLFVLKIRWVAASGEVSLRQVFLPALTLGLVASPQLMRVLRASMLAEINRLYMVFGRAQGIPERRLILRHAFRNAMLPAVTLMGMSFSGLLCGSAIIETVFSWPGIGKYLIDSIYIRDYPVVQAYALFTTAIVVLINLCVDILYTLLEPRIRFNAKGIR